MRKQGDGSDRVWPVIDHALCDGCGNCVSACPVGALELVAGRPVLKPGATCAYCAECEAACPRGAIGCPYDVVFAEDA